MAVGGRILVAKKQEFHLSKTEVDGNLIHPRGAFQSPSAKGGILVSKPGFSRLELSAEVGTGARGYRCSP